MNQPQEAGTARATEALRLLVFAAEFPYPPTHGGRADTWQRLRAFAEAGVRMMLVCWYSDRRGRAPTDAELAVVRTVVDVLVVLPIEIGWRDLLHRLRHLPSMPSHASARLPQRSVLRDLLAQARQFNAQAVWLDGLWAGAAARTVAQQLACPCYYRSHNIEFRYMRRQTALARSWVYRTRLALNLPGLERFERMVVLQADHVFDISVDDLAYWQSQGLVHGTWLPPFVRAPSRDEAADPATPVDVVFVGNLHTPNNVAGLRWLFGEVWPQVLARRPTATALVAGSAPTQEVRNLLEAAHGVELLADPPDVWPLYRRARVLVNPARSGSGVQVKSLEMLQFDVDVVSTSIGVGGLPASVRAQFVVADAPEDFAVAVAEMLARADAGPVTAPSAARDAARGMFQPQAIQGVIDVMRAQREQC